MQSIEDQVSEWLNRVVVGLNLCPFAKTPSTQKTVRFAVTPASSDDELLTDLQLELDRLQDTPAEQLETTLLIIPKMLARFEDYNDFLDKVDWLLEEMDWLGVFQVASFHPEYCFAGTQPEDAENLTNRSPYPIFHIIREHSLTKALESYPNPETIPAKNIALMQSLSTEEIAELFPHIKPNVSH